MTRALGNTIQVLNRFEFMLSYDYTFWETLQGIVYISNATQCEGFDSIRIGTCWPWNGRIPLDTLGKRSLSSYE